MSVGITIPFYKRKDQLEKCNKAIENQTYKVKEILVHDNTEVNLGFTKAVNIGLKHFMDETKYTIVLNQDCYLKEDAVEKMVEFMDNNPLCAIGGIKQISTNDDNLIIHGGCQKAFPGGVHIIGSVEKGDCSKNLKMPWVNGACMIVNNQLMKEFGVMDEQFYLICSDSDWCYTARQRGFEVWYIADAICYHEDGISKDTKRSDEVERLMKLDTVYFADKWIAGGNFRELSMEIFDD